MTPSYPRARILTVVAAAIGALALGTTSATASPRAAQANSRTGGVTHTVVHRRKSLTSWRTQRLVNPLVVSDAPATVLN